MEEIYEKQMKDSDIIFTAILNKENLTVQVWYEGAFWDLWYQPDENDVMVPAYIDRMKEIPNSQLDLHLKAADNGWVIAEGKKITVFTSQWEVESFLRERLTEEVQVTVPFHLMNLTDVDSLQAIKDYELEINAIYKSRKT